MLRCSACAAAFHVHCLAEALRQQNPRAPPSELPSHGHCTSCGAAVVWLNLLSAMQFEGWGGAGKQRRGRQPRCAPAYFLALLPLLMLVDFFLRAMDRVPGYCFTP